MLPLGHVLAGGGIIYHLGNIGCMIANTLEILADKNHENGGAKLDHGSGGEVLLRAA